MVHICGLHYVSLDSAELKHREWQALGELMLMRGARVEPREGEGKQRNDNKEVLEICLIPHFCYVYNLFCPQGKR